MTGDQPRTEPFFWAAIGVLSVIIVLALTLANLFFGSLNQDEGWYLLAARMVSAGAMPYRDFAFTQGPVMPVLYAPLTPLIDRGGMLAARAVTATLGLLTVWTAAALAVKWTPPSYRRTTWWLTVMVAGINVYQSYFTVIVKTYAAAGLLLTAGFYLLGLNRQRPSRWALCGSAAALVLAAGARISLVVVAPLMLFALLRLRQVWPRAWLWFGVSGAATAAAVFLPVALAAPEGLWFGMVEYHAGRVSGGLFSALVLKAGFVSRMVQAYYPAFVIGLGLLAGRLFYGPVGVCATTPQILLKRFAGWSLALVTMVHVASPFPYDDYQTVIYAPACALLIAAFVRRIDYAGGDRCLRLRWAAVCLLAAVTASSFASPINQDWFVSGRDRIWWRFKSQPDIMLLRDAARRVRDLCDEPGCELLTQDPYLAIEAGCRVPVGLTMGPFSYFPDMPTERARRLHVLNRDLMLELLRQSRAPVAAFSGYGLAIEAPSVTELPRAESDLLWSVLFERYELYDTLPDFGQAHTTLRILRRRDQDRNRN